MKQLWYDLITLNLRHPDIDLNDGFNELITKMLTSVYMAFENKQHCLHQNGITLFGKKSSSLFHEILALPM